MIKHRSRAEHVGVHDRKRKWPMLCQHERRPFDSFKPKQSNSSKVKHLKHSKHSKYLRDSLTLFTIPRHFSQSQCATPLTGLRYHQTFSRTTVIGPYTNCVLLRTPYSPESFALRNTSDKFALDPGKDRGSTLHEANYLTVSHPNTRDFDKRLPTKQRTRSTRRLM